MDHLAPTAQRYRVETSAVNAAGDLAGGTCDGARCSTGDNSYRSASTGSRFAARDAGITALSTPTSSNPSVEIVTVKNEILRWMSAFPESSSNKGPISGSVPTPTATR